MRVWLADFQFHLAMAMRAVGVGLVAVAWASALTSEAQQLSDTRTYLQVAVAVLSLVVVAFLTRLPPSWTGEGLLEPLERDIAAVARECADGDPVRQAEYAAAIRELAIQRMRQGVNVPRERRAWVRALSRLSEPDQT